MRLRLTFFLLLGIVLLTASPVLAQKANLTIYAYPFLTKTSIPIKEEDIKDCYTLKLKFISENFVQDFEKILKSKPVWPEAEMLNVRFLIEVKHRREKWEIVIDNNGLLRYHDRYYRLDKDLNYSITRLLPQQEREKYGPKLVQTLD